MSYHIQKPRWGFVSTTSKQPLVDSTTLNEEELTASSDVLFELTAFYPARLNQIRGFPTRSTRYSGGRREVDRLIKSVRCVGETVASKRPPHTECARLCRGFSARRPFRVLGRFPRTSNRAVMSIRCH
jgi:hypothetical protein